MSQKTVTISFPFSLVKYGVFSTMLNVHLSKMISRFSIIEFILPGYLVHNNSN